MTLSEIQEALSIITEKYEASISEYLQKVISAEARHGHLEAAEILSLAYIILDRAFAKYDSTKGPFRNYAIRAIRNELIRSKTSSEVLYEDFQYDETTVSAENMIADSAGLNSVLETGETSIEHTLMQQQAAAHYLLVSAKLLKSSPLEKALLYFVFYSSDQVKTTSLREISNAYSLSYYRLTKILTTTLAKIEKSLY